MSITFTRQDGSFRLTTRNTLYFFRIYHGIPVHLYYGKKRGGSVPKTAELPHLRASFSPYYEENTLDFSFDLFPLEYSYFGSGDFRTTALRIRNADGNSVTHFSYRSHRIYKGRVDLAPIPAGRPDEKTETLELCLLDETSHCELRLYYTVFYDSDVITRYASVMSCHVSDPKGDLRTLDTKFRVATAGILGYEFNVLATPEEIKSEIRKEIAEYRTYDHLIQNGIHYRLASPYESDYSAWYYQSNGEFLLTAIHTDGKRVIGKKKKVTKLPLRTADPNAIYRDTLSGRTYSGAELRAGIEIGDFLLDDHGFGGKSWHFVAV